MNSDSLTTSYDEHGAADLRQRSSVDQEDLKEKGKYPKDLELLKGYETFSEEPTDSALFAINIWCFSCSATFTHLNLDKKLIGP